MNPGPSEVSVSQLITVGEYRCPNCRMIGTTRIDAGREPKIVCTCNAVFRGRWESMSWVEGAVACFKRDHAECGDEAPAP